ncbi:MAG: hypothetical protein ACXVNM_11910, partial [Bacteroidia bacterium]
NHRTTIINQLDKPVFYTLSSYDTIEGKSPYNYADNFIDSKSSKQLMVGGDFENIVRNNFHNKMTIFFFDADTLKKYQWEKIKKENKWKRKITFSVEDLRKNNWKVYL